jgi:hypothetical protein
MPPHERQRRDMALDNLEMFRLLSTGPYLTVCRKNN